MRPGRKLLLRRESMTDLGSDDLRAVAGASGLLCTYWLTDLTCLRCPSIPFTNCTILQETDSVTCPTDIC